MKSKEYLARAFPNVLYESINCLLNKNESNIEKLWN